MRRISNVISVALALLALAVGFGQQPVMATVGLATGLGSLLGGVGDTVGHLTNSLGPVSGNILNAVPNVLNSASNVVGEVTKPVMGLLGTLTGGQSNPLAQLSGAARLGAMAEKPISNGLQLTSGMLGGLTSGVAAGAGLGNVAPANSMAQANSMTQASSMSQASSMENNLRAASMNEAAAYGSMSNPAYAGMVMRNNFKREALASSMLNNQLRNSVPGAEPLGVTNPLSTMDAARAAAIGAHMGELAPSPMVPNAELSGAAASSAAASASASGATSGAASAAAAIEGVNQAANHILSRQALASDAVNNAQAEAAIAGADMVAHGANNARSASLASNAYRQAKLASARDRVNIAGTIQNSARISDAAIATHDASTKAEDSLLGSELAVDSAATVLDSDAAYIPPVTSSLLRSLPYGRLGLRNIVPKPLTYPSVLLPDVWLNGAPVQYLNVPLRMLPYGIGSTAATNPLWQSSMALANGAVINGQPFVANNGRYLNGLVYDPAVAYLSGHLNGVVGSSILPILANGQLEAQDEIAAANMLTMQLLGGQGMSATYQGYGRMNPVPLITGSVTDANLMPTTIIGTTYPIGSALVIEPRDSYFQDYIDNASSRQNFDEKQQ